MTTQTTPYAEIATEVRDQWLTEALANRRDNLLELIEDVQDDTSTVYWEMVELLPAGLQDDDELELDGELNREISAHASELYGTLPTHLIRMLIDEQGGLNEIRQWLPLPVIGRLQTLLLGGYEDTAVTLLLLEIVIDAVANKTMGY
jgi:hypothetical protein